MAKAIEQFGSGFKRVDSLCDDFGIIYSYEMYDLGFDFTFYRKKLLRRGDQLVYEGYSKISKQAELVYQYLKEKPDYSRKELAELMSRHIRTIQRYLNELVDKGYIERVGSDKAGHWRIIKL